MKKNLYIIGAGGLGRQLESYLELLPSFNLEWELKGYLDDNKDALKNKASDYKVLGSIKDFEFSESDSVLVAIADTKTKKEITSLLKNRVSFFSYVAHDALIGKNVSLGKGCIICPGAKIGSNVTIGNFNLINLDTIVGHDSILGDNCSIMPDVAIGGGSHIEGGAFIGTKASISPRLRITAGTHIGVGAVVIKNIDKQGTYFGNPARKML